MHLCFIFYSTSQGIGFLQIKPVASWGLILLVGIIEDVREGLKLDLYTKFFYCSIIYNTWIYA